MTNRRCLYCYKELKDGEIDFHARCSLKIFGTSIPPDLPITEEQMRELAQKVIQSQGVVTGVQPKLSLHVTGDNVSKGKRFTIVGALGDYILKPHTDTFPTLPEVEDVTMHLAALCGISTVPHSLIRMRSGNLAYITKRVDRSGLKKLHMEDMCQLSGRLTEDKYKGSYEQIAKIIVKYSDAPGLDAINFFEQVIFCFLTGNADMHLKNFSLITLPDKGTVLAPAYDMVCTKLVMPSDDEDLALTLNAKKKKITKKDFDAAFSTVGITHTQAHNIYSRMRKSVPKWNKFIENSYLQEDEQAAYKAIIADRKMRLEL